VNVVGEDIAYLRVVFPNFDNISLIDGGKIPDFGDRRVALSQFLPVLPIVKGTQLYLLFHLIQAIIKLVILLKGLALHPLNVLSEYVGLSPKLQHHKLFHQTQFLLLQL
jgi:hypothetical protein